MYQASRFMGGQNVFAGRVSGIADGVIALDLSERGRIEFPAGDPVPSIGSTVHISIRRDRVHLTKRGAMGTVNTLAAKCAPLNIRGPG